MALHDEPLAAEQVLELSVKGDIELQVIVPVECWHGRRSAASDPQ